VVEAEHPLAAGEEVTRVLEEVEADDVRVEHAAQQLVAARPRRRAVTRRPGRGEVIKASSSVISYRQDSMSASAIAPSSKTLMANSPASVVW